MPSTSPTIIRIFLSSPGDVAEERRIAHEVITKLSGDPEFSDKVNLEVIAWDAPGANMPLLANMTPQDAINQGMPKPSECDIVVVIFWSRMGTPLPFSDYKKLDGSRYLSGTEWEYLDAYEASRKAALPVVSVYRRLDKRQISLDEPNVSELIEQYQRVNAFFASFINEDGSIARGYNSYELKDFYTTLEGHMRRLIAQVLAKKAAGGDEPTISEVLLDVADAVQSADEPETIQTILKDAGHTLIKRKFGPPVITDHSYIQKMFTRRYQVDEHVFRQTGSSSSYLAKDMLAGGIKVELKRLIIFDDTNTDFDELLALAREFRVLSSLRHPNIISVYDYGFDAEGQPYMTTESSENTRTITQYANDQSIEAKVELLLQVCNALMYLHKRGILHRDVKPGNILVTDAGAVKLSDFGLAVSQEGLDETEGVVGTLSYMAPEVLQGEIASRESDLYALGGVAYELFAGRHPFNRSNLSELLNAVITQSPNITALKVNDQLAEVVRRLLEKDPANRYGNAEDVANDLRAAIGLPPLDSYSIRDSFLIASHFIGREKKLNELKIAFENTLLGSGGVFLLGGESGVGKTRLLEEFRIFAQAQGCLILRGQAIREGGQPYQLWHWALRDLAVVTDILAQDASILLPIIPDLNEILRTDYPSAASLGEAEDRKRLDRTIARVFGELQHPIVLILEDLHWAEIDLEPLRILAAQGRRLLIMVVGSYRDDEAPDLPAQIPHAHVIKLERLAKDEISNLSASIR